MSRTRTSNLYLILVLSLGIAACGSSRPCPPCYPEIKPVEVPHPYPVVLVIELLPPLVLDVVPAMAPADAPAEDKKTNALAIAEARERNHARLVARDDAWTLKIKHHNSLAEDVRRHEPE